MSKGKAFFSTLPGIISALAGLVTVIVGVLAISAQLGGDDDGGDVGNGGSSATSSTLAAGGGGAGGSGGSNTPTASGRLSANPPRLTFAVLATKEATVTISHDADGRVALDQPKIDGTDSAQYSATSDCAPSLDAGRSCTVKVTFKPTKTGKFTAKLVVASPTRGVKAVEVEIEGNHVL